MLGIEVATGAVSVAARRLWIGLGATLNGHEYLISATRYVSGFTILLGGVGLFSALLWAETEGRGIVIAGEICPHCGTTTKRVRRRAWHRVLSRILETNVTRRRCERCGWNGLAA
jgi:ribosomal protein S27AE